MKTTLKQIKAVIKPSNIVDISEVGKGINVKGRVPTDQFWKLIELVQTNQDGIYLAKEGHLRIY
jgi:hypothetical protein